MAALTLRSVKGSPLTNNEVDANFDNLNTELAGKLVAANNLSDLASATTSRTNLGLGTAATANSTDFDPAGTAVALAIALG